MFPSHQQTLHHQSGQEIPFQHGGTHHQAFQQLGAGRHHPNDQLLQDVHHPLVLPHQVVHHEQQPPQSSDTQVRIGFPQVSRKRRRANNAEDEIDLLLQAEEEEESFETPSQVLPSQGHSQRQRHAIHQQHLQPQPTHHHHHRLPSQAPATKRRLLGTGSVSSPEAMSTGLPSAVGQAGMPDPAPRPRGPKLKFSPEDDQLLVDLKENKNLTWKQIAEFFPGRSSGTLQVRYCTKLKAKTTVWTDDTVSSC